MKNIFVVSLLFLNLGSWVQAQPSAIPEDPKAKIDITPSPGNPNMSLIEGAIVTVQALTIAGFHGKPAGKDQIEGQCSFEGGSCAGAIVAIYSLDGKKVDEQTITSESQFRFTNLKKPKYKMVVRYPRYQSEFSSEAEIGHAVSITLNKKTL